MRVHCSRPLPLRTAPRLHCLIAGPVIALLVAGPVRAQESAPGAKTLTEVEVVLQALSRGALADLLEGGVAVEEGRARTESAFANPEISYAREQTYGSAAELQGTLSIAQSFDIAGRRGLRREAGAARAEAARRDADGVRLGVVAEARTRFFDLLHRQLRTSALESWLRHVEQALSVVKRREERGDVATYDRRRLEREQFVATARLAAERASLERAAARLQALLGEPAPLAVTGELLPESDPAALAELRTKSRSRPDLMSLDLRVRASDLEGRAAGRWWLPDLRIEGGWKRVDLPGAERSDGYVAGASLALPLWDRSWGLSRAAAGEAQRARGERGLLEAELVGELAGARTEAVQARRAAADLRAHVGSTSADLMRMAVAGYAGGELGVIELLDAYRGSIDDELSALDLERDARRARIELDRMTGADSSRGD